LTAIKISDDELDFLINYDIKYRWGGRVRRKIEIILQKACWKINSPASPDNNHQADRGIQGKAGGNLWKQKVQLQMFLTTFETLPCIPACNRKEN